MHRRLIEERQIPVRRARGEYLDMPGPRKGGERSDEVAAEAANIRVAMRAIELRIEARDRSALRVPVANQALDV
jgi:hypothetical protein